MGFQKFGGQLGLFPPIRRIEEEKNAKRIGKEPVELPSNREKNATKIPPETIRLKIQAYSEQRNSQKAANRQLLNKKTSLPKF